MGSATSATGEMRPYDTPVSASDVSNGDKANSDEIRADIEATRAEMSETVDAIQARFSPQSVQATTDQVIQQAKLAALEVAEQVTERVKDSVREATIGRVEKMAYNMKETTRGASSSLLETVKANPVPAALIGLGVAWLLMNKSDSSSGGRSNSYSGERYSPDQRYDSDYRDYRSYRDYRDPQTYAQGQGNQARMGARFGAVASDVQDKAGQVANTVTEAADNVKGKAGEFVGRAQDQMGQFGGRVQDQAQTVMDKSQNMIEDNPLMVGALAVALGAAIGFILPVTERENEFMGEARDRLVSQAGEAAQDTLGKVQRVASEALQAAQDTVKEEAKNQGLSGNGNTNPAT